MDDSEKPCGLSYDQRQFVINAVADGGRDLPALVLGEALADVVAIAKHPRCKARERIRAAQALIRYEMHRQTLALKSAESQVQQHQIRDLQNQLADRPVESQPLRIVIEEIDDRPTNGPNDQAVAPSNAGAEVAGEHAADVRTA